MDKNTKILIVDDFSTMRRIISNLLNELGYKRITEAEDGITALSLLNSDRFDFVITDCNIPGMQGIELLNSMRKDKRLANIPVLMIFAEQKRGKIVEAAKAGVNGYIVKPFTGVTLNQKLEKIWSRSPVNS